MLLLIKILPKLDLVTINKMTTATKVYNLVKFFARGVIKLFYMTSLVVSEQKNL